MIYLISQDWVNTTNNHAGIKYLCNKLKSDYPHLFESLVIPIFINDLAFSKNRFVRKAQSLLSRIKHILHTRKLRKQLQERLRAGDSVILMEYMDKSMPLYSFAWKLKRSCPQNSLYAMVHLVPQKYEKSFPKESDFRSWIYPIDKIITLGHSLTEYLVSRGCDRKMIHTSFHYVDSYYNYERREFSNDKLVVIAMGNQMRNVSLLKKIVAMNSTTDFIVCQGVNDLTKDFSMFSNVSLVPFVEESELRGLMMRADVSLNVMEDTIGSNVIVTSLAMGLAMVCSDVGSIRDYCDDSNTIFCKNQNPDEFSNAIKKLSEDKSRVESMQKKAYLASKRFCIPKFVDDLLKL